MCVVTGAGLTKPPAPDWGSFRAAPPGPSPWRRRRGREGSRRGRRRGRAGGELEAGEGASQAMGRGEGGDERGGAVGADALAGGADHGHQGGGRGGPAAAQCGGAEEAEVGSGEHHTGESEHGPPGEAGQQDRDRHLKGHHEHRVRREDRPRPHRGRVQPGHQDQGERDLGDVEAEDVDDVGGRQRAHPGRGPVGRVPGRTSTPAASPSARPRPLENGTAVLVRRASVADPYACVEVGNPDGRDAVFSMKMRFKDGRGRSGVGSREGQDGLPGVRCRQRARRGDRPPRGRTRGRRPLVKARQGPAPRSCAAGRAPARPLATLRKPLT